MPNIPILILFSFTLLISSSAALDISIGGGSITTARPAPPPPCPPSPSPPALHHPPPPPPYHPPQPFQLISPPSPKPSPLHQLPDPDINKRLALDFYVIMRFKSLIRKNVRENDPNNITSTWTGGNPCNFRGFNCSKSSNNPTHKFKTTLSEVQFNGFNFGGVQLTGFIDKLLDVSIFHANTNRFSGTIPATTSTSLPFLFKLYLSNNKLDGVVPESLCALPSLQNLTLSYNYFTEVGPKCRALIDRKVLDVTGNCISGLRGQRDPKVCNEFFKGHPSGCSSENLNYAPCKAAEHGNAGKVNGRRRAEEVAEPVFFKFL